MKEVKPCKYVGDDYTLNLCLTEARTKCFEESTLIDQFQCDSRLSQQDCIDIYSVALFHSKIPKEELLQRISFDNQEDIGYFLDLLNTVRVEIHSAPHTKEATVHGGDWNYEFGEDVQAVKALLQDLQSLQQQYAVFKEQGIADKIKAVRGSIPELHKKFDTFSEWMITEIIW